MNYFIGRYEGLTGLPFEEAMTEATLALDEDPELLVSLTETCVPRMESFGNRLTEWGNAMEDLEAEQRAEATE